MEQKPEALELADSLECEWRADALNYDTALNAAAELRRLHAENESLREQNTLVDQACARLEAENEALRGAGKLALDALKNVQITGPDADGVLWINLPGNRTTGKAILRVGKEGLIASQCAKFFESDRTKAIAAIDAAMKGQP